MVEVSSRPAVSVLPLISIHRFSQAATSQQLSKALRKQQPIVVPQFLAGKAEEKKRKGTDLGVSVWCSETAVSITSRFCEAYTSALMMLSFMQEKDTPKFPSHGHHFLAPRPEVSSWTYWTIFKIGLKSCSRHSSVMWSKQNLPIWTSANTADGGPDVPLFLAEDHIGSWYHLLKLTHSANLKKDPTEPLPTSLRSPRSWRGFDATERTGEFARHCSWDFQSWCTSCSLVPKDPQCLKRSAHRQ